MPEKYGTATKAAQRLVFLCACRFPLNQREQHVEAQSMLCRDYLTGSS